LLFVLAMLVGIALHRVPARRAERAAERGTVPARS
jgi:hypothetical protein